MPRAPIVLILLALAGCGSAAAAKRPTDAQIARRAVITLRDLPSGWNRGRPGRHADCPAFNRARRTASAWAESARFVRDGDRREVAGIVFVFARPAGARRVFAQLRSPVTRSCYASRLRLAVRSILGARLGGVTAFATRVDPLGDEQAGARFVVAYAYGHRRRVLYIDQLVVRTGRGIATELYTSDGAPLGGGLRYDLTALTARRLAGELG